MKFYEASSDAESSEGRQSTAKAKPAQLPELQPFYMTISCVMILVSLIAGSVCLAEAMLRFPFGTFPFGAGALWCFSFAMGQQVAMSWRSRTFGTLILFHSYATLLLAIAVGTTFAFGALQEVWQSYAFFLLTVPFIGFALLQRDWVRRLDNAYRSGARREEKHQISLFQLFLVLMMFCLVLGVTHNWYHTQLRNWQNQAINAVKTY